MRLTHKTLKFPAVFLLLAAACWMSKPVSATVLLQEDFSAYSSSALNGQTAATLNLSGAWLAASDAFGSFTVNNDRLEFARTNTGGTAVPKYARVEIANHAATIANSTEFWAYGVMDEGNTSGGYFSTSLFADAVTPRASPFVNNLVFGLTGGKAFIATDSSRHSNSTGSGIITITNQTLSTQTFAGGPHSLLVKLVNLGTVNDAYQLWVDPDLSAGVGMLGTPDVEITTGNLIFNDGSHLFEPGATYTLDTSTYLRSEVRYTFLANGSSSGWMDDYRLATTFDDLVNIPEPGRATLLLLALGGCLTRRRRAICCRASSR